MQQDSSQAKTDKKQATQKRTETNLEQTAELLKEKEKQIENLEKA